MLSDEKAQEVQRLKSELQQVYQKLAQKDKDLQVYKNEVQNLNAQIKTLIQNIQYPLLMASKVQKYLVPTEIPKIPGFEFSTKYISGPDSSADYFDIFQLKDQHRFGVILASSSGHTMASLFLSVLIQVFSQIEAKKGISPSKILESLDEKITSSAQPGEKSHVFLMIINRHTLDMTYCSGGNIMAWFQPRHLSGQTQHLQYLNPTRSAIGLHENHKKLFLNEKAEVKISMNAKDRIIMVSPGLTSTIKDKAFIENLLVKMKTKNPHDVRNELIYQTQKHKSKTDRTVLVIDVKDRVLKLTSI